MYLELANGKDSFREQQGSPRRNVEIFLHIVPPNYEKVEPIHIAYQHKIKGTGAKHMLSHVPATSRVRESPGAWYNTRYEMVPNTIVIIQHKQADAVRMFDVATTWVVLRASETEPLYNLICDLPPHFMADITTVAFKGRFELLEEPEDYDALDGYQQHALLKFFNVEDDNLTELANIAAKVQWEDVFTAQVLERSTTTPSVRAAPQEPKIIKGKEVASIRRIRRIKT